MTMTPDIAAAIPRACAYAIDRGAREDTREDFAKLAALSDDVLEDLIIDLQRRRGPGEHALAALLAAQLPAQRALERLADVVDSERDPRVLIAAAEALGELRGAASSQQLERLARRDEPGVRRTVAATLYKRDDASAFEALLELSRDPDLDTRGWAAWALADGFPSDERRDEALRAFLHSTPDSQLAAHIRDALRPAGKELPEIIPRPQRKRRRVQSAPRLVVLVVSANPTDATQLALDEEVRQITAGLRSTPGRDAVDLRSAWAMRPTDLLRELNEHRPAVLHFSGHGTADGRLVFLDASGSARPVANEAIAAAIASAGQEVRLVVLNACFSADLARTLTRHVDIAVGMDRPVGDEAARVFAQSLYSALGYGYSVGHSFDQAGAALMLEGIPEEQTPQLSMRAGVDAYEVVLVDPATARPVDPQAQRDSLARVTIEHLAHLERHSRLPIGEGVELTRASGPAIAQTARSASILVLGAPGSGKTGALYGFAREAIGRGRDVVVLAADLLEASGRRSLSEELGLAIDLVDVLAAWPGDEPAYLVVDALDATRGRESASVLLELLEHVAARAGRWRVVASVRSFDLRHNPALQAAFPVRGGDNDGEFLDEEFRHVRHIALGGLSDEELSGLASSAPAVAAFLSAAQPAARELARVPFNLRLLVLLLQRGEVDRADLESIRTQLELLDLYWDSRVLGQAPGRDARELFAERLCEEAVDAMRLQVPRERLRRHAAQGIALEELLGEGVLVEASAIGPRRRESVGFSHHVLFDYAVHRLILSGTPDEIAARLVANTDLVLLARPSLVLTLAAEWSAEPGRNAFWTLALRLAEPEVPVAARIVAPAVAARETRNPDDFLPLLEAIDQGDARAPFLLAHAVGARTAIGERARPLAGRDDDLPIWSGLASALSTRIRQEVAYPLRLLVWGLSVEYEGLGGRERAALGAAARALLQWAWSQSPPPSTEVGVALDAVARSCATDPHATRALLLHVTERERIPNFGSYELGRLADELGTLAACVPDVVERLYEAAYAYEEDSQNETSFGSSQILRMTSTKEQDWRMARYGLAQEYPRVLKADVRTGVRVLAYACAHEAADRAYDRPDRDFSIELASTRAKVRPDSSEYWDWDSRHRDASAMLDAFEERLAQAAATGERQTVEAVFEVLSERPQPAAIWRRVVRAAVREPDALARDLARPLASPGLLTASDLLEPVGALLPIVFENLSADQRTLIEEAILALPNSYPAGRREVGEHRRDQLLGVLPAPLLQTQEARVRAEDLAATGAAPRPEQPFDIDAAWSQVSEEEAYLGRGIDAGSPPNKRLLALIAPVSEFVRAHSNKAPSPEAIEAAVPQIQALRSGLVEPSRDAAKWIVDEGQAWLCEAAATLARQTPLPVGDPSVQLARELALEGARAVLPGPEPEELEQFDSSAPSWGVPSGRIDAARALLFLSREPAAVDGEVLEGIAKLACDPHPAVRWSVAYWLGLARQVDEEWTWALIDRIRQIEPSAQVQKGLLRSIGRFANDQVERAAKAAHAMYEREAADSRRDSLLRALARFLIELWIWRGEHRGRVLVDQWAADIERHAELAGTVLVALRDPVTHGGDAEADARIRSRAIDAWSVLSGAAGEAFHRFEERQRAGEVLDEGGQGALRAVAHLLDTSASELYFASGAYAETGKSKQDRLAPETRERFYREAEPIFDALLSVGLPSIAHHVLQTLASFVELDPHGVLLRLDTLLEAGRTWRYQFESLAETEFVALVESYLAGQRDLLMRDRVARGVLVRALESFVEAGWPSARRLMYGLDDMFR